jgi:hypothetical protein
VQETCRELMESIGFLHAKGRAKVKFCKNLRLDLLPPELKVAGSNPAGHILSVSGTRS